MVESGNAHWCLHHGSVLREALTLSDEAKTSLSDDGPTVQAPVGVPGFRIHARNKLRITCGLSITIAAGVVLYVASRHPSRPPSSPIPAPVNSGAMASDLAAEQACLDYTAPADQVVYEEDPELIKRYLGEGGEWVDLSRAANRCGVPAAGRVPACWPALSRTSNQTPLPPAAAVVFMHERRAPAGLPELVVVAYDGQMRLPWATPGAWTISSIGLSASVKSPAVPGSPLPPWHGAAHRLDAEPFVAMYRLRLYAGQPDAIDPTHFTIRYELDGPPASTGPSPAGTIDGWVLDVPTGAATQTVVKFTVRDGEAKLTREQMWSPEEILRDHREQGLREGKRSWGVWTGD